MWGGRVRITSNAPERRDDDGSTGISERLSNIEHAPKEKSPRGRAPHLGQQKAATGIEAVTAFRLTGKRALGFALQTSISIAMFARTSVVKPAFMTMPRLIRYSSHPLRQQ
jgi:hypothetical protein